MGVLLFSEALLVPSSLFLTIAYHAYLCHRLKHKPRLTTIGTNSIKRRLWLQQVNQGDDKKGALGVQSLRNTFMATILTGLVTIMMSLCLSALINNTFNAASHLRFLFPKSSGLILGLQSQSAAGSKIITVKFGSAYISLMTSFLSSSMGLSYLVDFNFLINAIGHFSGCECYTQTIMERGFTLVVVGNRLLCITFPLLFWMFGPIPMLISSLALTWVLYQLDFHSGRHA